MALFNSDENLIFNGIDIAASFDDGDDSYFVVQEVTGRSPNDVAVVTASVPGRRGSYYRRREFPDRILTIKFALKAESYEDLRKDLEQLNKLLYENELNEIQFTDELDRTYYGYVSSVKELEEDSRIHKGEINIVCTDPLKYGGTITKPFVDGQVTVQNGGAVTAEPIYRFQVLRDITHLDVFTENDYMRIGRPLDVDKTPTNPKTPIMIDEASSRAGWENSLTVEEPDVVTGNITSSGVSFIPNPMGEGTGWHGPAIQRDIGASLDNFEVEVGLHMMNPTKEVVGKVVIELLDEQGEIFARMLMYKNQVGAHGNTGQVRAGTKDLFYRMIDTNGDTHKEWNNFKGVLRITRKGNSWSAYIAQVNPTTKKHHSRASGSYIDRSGFFPNKLRSVRVHFAAIGDRPWGGMTVEEVLVYRLNDLTPEEVPVIAQAGDEIEINHQTSEIRINGELRNDLKDFGANFFEIEKGFSTTMFEPQDAVSGEIIYREGYL